ncbi:hypothetical protein BH23DEI1_BH23DEI1_25000 [soil metagenome]
MQRLRPSLFGTFAAAIILVLAACSGPLAALDDGAHDVVTLGSLSTKGVSFGLGSLITSGTVTGIDRNGLTIEVDAEGYYELLCGNPGGSRFVAPGVNPVAAVVGSAEFPYSSTARGRLVFDGAEAIVLDAPTLAEMTLSAAALCPNAGWTIAAKDDFFYWTGVTLRFYDEIGDLDGPVIVQEYACVSELPTTAALKGSISCTMTSGSTKAGGKR